MKKMLIVASALIIGFSVYAMEGMMKGAKCPVMKGDRKAGCASAHGICCMENTGMKVENTRDGVKITISSKDKEAVKAIQECAADMLICHEKSGAAMAAGGKDMATCPVMGERIMKKDAYSVTEYKGKKYYFCCAKCAGLFEKNPEKYSK